MSHIIRPGGEAKAGEQVEHEWVSDRSPAKVEAEPGRQEGIKSKPKSIMLGVPNTGSQPLAFITEQGWTAGVRKACTRWAQDIVGSEFASIGISMVRPTVGR